MACAFSIWGRAGEEKEGHSRNFECPPFGSGKAGTPQNIWYHGVLFAWGLSQTSYQRHLVCRSYAVPPPS